MYARASPPDRRVSSVVCSAFLLSLLLTVTAAQPSPEQQQQQQQQQHQQQQGEDNHNTPRPSPPRTTTTTITTTTPTTATAPPAPHANNKRSLSNAVLGRQAEARNDAGPQPRAYDVTTLLTSQCDVRNHSGCKVERYERCLNPGYCGCLHGYLRRGTGECVGAQFFQGKLSVVDTFPQQALTKGSKDYNIFVSELTSLVLRALSMDRAIRGVLRVRMTSLSRAKERVLIGWEVAMTPSSNWNAEKLTRVFNKGLVTLAYLDDRDSLIKLNDTHFVLGANGTNSNFLQPISEFSHCINKDYNYCDVSATCVHNLGFFTCTCRQGFDDVSPDVKDSPGERCVESCPCQNNGVCERDSSGNLQCQCADWYLGTNCGVNGKEILIITCSVVGALVLLVVILCLLRYCFFRRARKSHGGGGGGGGSSMAGAGSSLDTSLVKLPRVWMDAPRFYEPPPRDKRRWSYVSDPVKYIDEYMLDDYAHVGSLPLPRSQDARKKYYAAYSSSGNVNHAYSTSTLPARSFPRY